MGPTSPWSLSGLAFSPSASSPSTSRISSPTSDLGSVPPLLQVQVVLRQLLPLLRKLPKKKRRKSQRKNPMTTWDSDFSTNVLGSNPTKRRISSLKQLKKCSTLSNHTTNQNNFCIMIL